MTQNIYLSSDLELLNVHRGTKKTVDYNYCFKVNLKLHSETFKYEASGFTFLKIIMTEKNQPILQPIATQPGQPFATYTSSSGMHFCFCFQAKDILGLFWFLGDTPVVLVQVVPYLGPHPVNMICPKCGSVITTSIEDETSCFLACCCYRYYDEFEEVKHTCPKCGELIGRYQA